MTKQEQVKAIFIEEAGEIIEKLDIDIIRFEENCGDFSLLNEIFRGVHTLKGNANAFGFTRLGEFVHHFEDVLDHYRSTQESIEEHNLELFVGSVDVIKEVMNCELDAIATLPQSYGGCLEKIKNLISIKKNKSCPKEETKESVAELKDLSLEFGLSCVEQQQNSIERSIKDAQAMQSEGLSVYRIDLTLDSDCYKRGFDYFLFLNMLAQKAVLLESFFNMEGVVAIDSFKSDENYTGRVSVVVLTPITRSEVDEFFEFLFDYEYEINLIEPLVVEMMEVVVKPSVETAKVADSSSINSMSSKSTIRIDTFKLDELFDSVGELVIAQNFIAQNDKIRSIDDESINRTIETLSKITKRIQDRVMSLRMVAIKDTFEKMKRVVRDTSKKTGKEVHLIVQGEDTEIDKTMIDSLSDPLIHIIRNAIDHGLESNADERIKAGKSTDGSVTLKAFHKSGNIVISVSDDGRGINKERVLAKAIERGVINGDENLTDSQIFALIMQPGFSTAESISDPRGVVSVWMW